MLLQFLEKSYISIPHPEKVEQIIEEMRREGREKLQILTDFDNTLTRAYVDGKKAPSIIAQVRDGNYLTTDYAPRAHALFAQYHPIELDPKVREEEKIAIMHEWWTVHFKLLVECGFNKQVIHDIVQKSTLQFRTGVQKVFITSYDNQIPIVIMSAAPGDMLEEHLKHEKLLFPNVHVIANLYEFDSAGNAIKIREPIIHSYNKHEVEIQGFPVFETVKHRTNVILMGDSLGDPGMIEGFTYEHLLKIGFLNQDSIKNSKHFQGAYDILFTNDNGMEEVCDMLQHIVNSKG